MALTEVKQPARNLSRLLNCCQARNTYNRREKAKKIREKMSNITDGSTCGGYNSSSYGDSGSDGRYESSNRKSYNDKPACSSYMEVRTTEGSESIVTILVENRLSKNTKRTKIKTR